MNTHFLIRDPSKLLRYRDSIYALDLLICAVAHLDCFTFLNNCAMTFEQICENFNTAPRPTDVMLSLFLAMELIEKVGIEYKLTDISREYLVSDSAASLVPYYASLKHRPQCKEFLSVLRTGKPARWSSNEAGTNWIESMQDDQFADEYTAAMDSRGVFLAQKLAEHINLRHYSSLLDVAGGSGIYACSISHKYKHLHATVLEIPPVDTAATRSIESKEMSDRVHVIAGDMFTEIPKHFDVHLFANVFHDWNSDAVQKLAKNSFASLRSHGSIVVFDAHLNKDKNGPLSVAEYSCLLMHSTEGRCYSTREIDEILQEVGFTNISVAAIAADRTAIIGNKD
ncbi:MAG: methyltransferase [Thermodesulfobacteriota bacterium]|nr:methyltransferase [Thermodesulfobacteriota bacterium]